MFRLLSMKNIRSLSFRSSVLSSSELRRRSCPLCNSHLVTNNSGKSDLSLYDRPNLLKRFSSKDLSLMAGVDYANEGILHSEEVVEMLEELEEIREGPELLENFEPEIISPISEKPIVKTKRKLVPKANRELLAKFKSTELEKACKERNLNHNLASYLELCVNCGFLNRGFGALGYYISRKTDVRITSVDVFNRLMEGYSRIGNVDKLMEIWSLMEQEKVKPNESSFASRFEAIAKSTKLEKAQLIKSTISLMENQIGIKLNDLFNRCKWKRNNREIVLKAVRAVHPRFIPSATSLDLSYSSNLLNHLNNKKNDKLRSPSEGLLHCTNLMMSFEEQLNMEKNYYIDIKSIEKSVEPNNLILESRSKLEQLKNTWGKSIMDALERDLSALAAINKNIPFTSKQINIYPYLIVLDKHEYKEILLHEIRRLAEGSETFSPTVSQLYREIGNQVKLRYDKKIRFEDGVVDKISKLYSDYVNWYLDPSSGMSKNGREQWQLIIYKHQQGPSVDSENAPWPYTILHAIGKFLYKIILRDIRIDFNMFRNNKTSQMVPGFYPVYRHQGYVNKEEIKPHPVLSRLYRAAHLPHLTYSVSELPMLTPPVPWSSLTTGGYIISRTNIIRLPNQAVQQWERLKEAAPSQLYPTYDALNQLASIPWIVNTQVLDVVIEVFNNGGNAKLDIPESPSSCILPDALLLNTQGKSDKYLAYRQRMLLRRRKAEMYSLWCDALYRLSLANHFRDRVFWLPHNMDFRGRVYPCPPHLNHLGSDMARSLLMFALGKPLGPEGFNWLKIHLVNLTGLKKRDSIADRLTFADEIMPDILDSATKPLDGCKWWMQSEEPWQTLACCIEIKKALDCPDGVEAYVCNFPVHQDGSCNGLQHYAALGRDSAGAYSVNLSPSDLPQDVYTCVCSIVERERAKDAANGINIAQVLDGFVKRKVIKQTVMTTVYGVTRFGARLQIAKQLKDIDDFPQEFVWQASNYLVSKTFASLREMFTSTREIQDWFTESARMVSQVCGQNVEYVTPLGLPVVQPYYRFKQIDNKKNLLGQVTDNAPFDMFERPNVLKQKNAFPPNFIHSLDSAHMMLTSLHCEQEGITFVSVHDCYWTHPCDVPIMNKICREQFVALHSEPILKDLSDFLIKKYGYSEESLLGDIEVVATTKRKLNFLLAKVPPTGDFDLTKVLKSIYFFS